MNYKAEFPDFGEMDVKIPDWLEDCSWHNDACPSFCNEELDIHLFVDYADPALREMALVEDGRFCVSLLSEIGCCSCEPLLITDDWEKVLEFLGKWRNHRIV